VKDYKLIFKIAYTGIAYTCFLIVFVFNNDEDWRAKYRHFKVPAYEFPAADLRGLQMALICRDEGESFLGVSECVTNAREVKLVYPSAFVPNFNYPELWVDIFSIIGGKNESDVMRVWRINAILSSLIILILSYRYQYIFMPVILFSPIFLLLVERGNIDGFILFLTFSPFIIVKDYPILKSAAITLAGVLKVYPLFGLPGLLKHDKPYITWWFVVPILLFTPLLYKTISQLSIINAVTMKHYFASYGVQSFAMLPWVRDLPNTEIKLYIIFVFIVTIFSIYFYKSHQFKMHVASIYRSVNSDNVQIILISLLIIVLTSITTTNWAYRFIFIVPAFLVFTNRLDSISTGLSILAIVTIWVPIVKNGWVVFNYFGMLFTILATAYILALAPIIFDAKKLRSSYES